MFYHIYTYLFDCFIFSLQILWWLGRQIHFPNLPDVAWEVSLFWCAIWRQVLDNSLVFSSCQDSPSGSVRTWAEECNSRTWKKCAHRFALVRFALVLRPCKPTSDKLYDEEEHSHSNEGFQRLPNTRVSMGMLWDVQAKSCRDTHGCQLLIKSVPFGSWIVAWPRLDPSGRMEAAGPGPALVGSMASRIKCREGRVSDDVSWHFKIWVQVKKVHQPIIWVGGFRYLVI